MFTTLVWISVVLLTVLGIVGTIVPALPGAPLVFFAILLAGWSDGFNRIGWATVTIAALLTILVLITDFIATTLGAKRVGASKLALIGAFVGTVIGIFFLIPGI